MSKSNSFEVAVLNATFKNTAVPALANIYIALFTSATSEGALGTEVSGGSYARLQVATGSGDSNITVTSGDPSSAVSAVTLTFPVATANWGTVTHFAIMDAASGGNVRYYGALPVAKPVLSGDQLKINAGDLVITED